MLLVRIFYHLIRLFFRLVLVSIMKDQNEDPLILISSFITLIIATIIANHAFF